MYADPVPELKRQLGTESARISDLRHGKLERFSLETLIRFAAHLGRRVELTVAHVRHPRRG
jgi:predicted XRE-type DNA-binding protein